LYLEGKGSPSGESTQFSWLGNGKYYTLTTVTDESDELLLTRIGANDPEFNLRREAGFMIRRDNSDNTIFVSVVEPHGSYSPVSELSTNPKSNIAKVAVVLDNIKYTAVEITELDGSKQMFILANNNASKSAKHSLSVNNKKYSWTGPFLYK